MLPFFRNSGYDNGPDLERSGARSAPDESENRAKRNVGQAIEKSRFRETASFRGATISRTWRPLCEALAFASRSLRFVLPRQRAVAVGRAKYSALAPTREWRRNALKSLKPDSKMAMALGLSPPPPVPASPSRARCPAARSIASPALQGPARSCGRGSRRSSGAERRSPAPRLRGRPR